MLTDADRKLLVEAQGGCWHYWETTYEYIDGRPVALSSIVCKKCGYLMLSYEDGNPTFSAPSELGPLILWAVKQEWWEDFDDIATEVWWPEGQSPRGDYLAWLFQSTEHFAKLLAAYLRKGE